MKIHTKQPTQEIAWLLEFGSPPIYFKGGDPNRSRETDDPWKAHRFHSRSAAQEQIDYIKVVYGDIKQWAATEHAFITP